MFNYNHLYYFYITAKLDGVTAAARHLRTSQPSLSMQLKTLETSLGFKLFKRSGRKLQLTDRGGAVLNYCQRAFEATEELAEYVRNPKIEKVIRFVIGVSDEIERPFVTDVIGEILRNWKGTKKPSVKMISGTHESLAGRFILGEIDHLFTTQRLYKQGSFSVSVERIPIVLVCKAGSVSRSLRKFPPHEILRRLPLDLTLPASELRLRTEIDQYMQKHNLSKDVIFESNILSALSRAVCDGLGVGFLPLPYVRKELAGKKLEVIGGNLLWSQIFLFYSSHRNSESGFAAAFRDQLHLTSETFRT
jgi:LysR family transcriptional activator of nhaA